MEALEKTKKVISTKIVKESEIKASKKINYFDDNEANNNIKKHWDHTTIKTFKYCCPMGKRK